MRLTLSPGVIMVTQMRPERGLGPRGGGTVSAKGPRSLWALCVAPGLPELGLPGTGFISHPLRPNSLRSCHPRPGRPRSGTWGGGSGGGGGGGGGGERGCPEGGGGGARLRRVKRCRPDRPQSLIRGPRTNHLSLAARSPPPAPLSPPDPRPRRSPQGPQRAAPTARQPRAWDGGAGTQGTAARRGRGGRRWQAGRARAEWVVLRPAPGT